MNIYLPMILCLWVGRTIVIWLELWFVLYPNSILRYLYLCNAVKVRKLVVQRSWNVQLLLFLIRTKIINWFSPPTLTPKISGATILKRTNQLLRRLLSPTCADFYHHLNRLFSVLQFFVRNKIVNAASKFCVLLKADLAALYAVPMNPSPPLLLPANITIL